MPKKLIPYGGILAAICGYAVVECIKKDYDDYTLKPLFCFVAGTICIGIGAKISYDASATTYDQFVKPCLKTAAAVAEVKNKNNGGLPPVNGLPPLPDIKGRL